MNEINKQDLVSYLEKASLVIVGLILIFFPLIFTSLTTDLYVLPKEAFLIFSVIVLMLLYGVKTYFSQSLKIKRTPFDFPILIFVGAIFLSVIFSVAKYDSIFNFVPFLFAAISFFAITYNVRDKKSVFVMIGSLIAGAALTSLISIFSFLKIYVFPFDFTHSQTFTPLGSTLDQALYLGFVLILGIYFLLPYVKKGKLDLTNKNDLPTVVGIGIGSLITLLGLGVSIYMLMTLQPPLILPLTTGFQTSFAAISQDGPRIIAGFLFGTGYGEFSIAFLRFKQAAFNTNPTLWNLTFFRSTNFILELLATTGILGLLSFFFLCYRIVKERPLFIPLVLIIATAFVLPFGFYHLFLIFAMLGIYSAMKGTEQNHKYFDVELQLVASKKGFFVLSSEEVGTKQQEKYGKTLSLIVLFLIVVFCGIFGFLTYDFTAGNVNFQKSLVAASQNNGTQTYTYQNNTLNSFTGRYVDSYYRVFSQTNLALANSLASSVPQGKTPSAQTSQTIYTLVQQSINAARSATNISPQNAIDWQNLSSVYRSLIGFGQNADSYAILAAQQSVALDPTNPQEYINLGGIYYQLKAWDNALAQFQQAINLKPDFANAYYNHAHALIEKGDLTTALTELQTVKTLVANDPTNLQKINDEIKTLQSQIASGQKTAAQNSSLNVNQPQTSLPPQNPPVKIPGPTASVTPKPTTTPPAVSPTTTPTP